MRIRDKDKDELKIKRLYKQTFADDIIKIS